MRPGCRGRVRERVEAVRAWPMWEHPPWLRAYIVAVVVVNLLAVALATRAGLDRKSTRLNSSHIQKSRMPSSA